jgi:hypothetical protein
VDYVVTFSSAGDIVTEMGGASSTCGGRGGVRAGFWWGTLRERDHGCPGCPTFLWQRPHRLLRVGSRASRRKITINGIPNRLNCCVILIIGLHMIYRCGRGPRIGDPCFNLSVTRM